MSGCQLLPTGIGNRCAVCSGLGAASLVWVMGTVGLDWTSAGWHGGDQHDGRDTTPQEGRYAIGHLVRPDTMPERARPTVVPVTMPHDPQG